jgi:hypothetical protein
MLGRTRPPREHGDLLRLSDGSLGRRLCGVPGDIHQDGWSPVLWRQRALTGISLAALLFLFLPPVLAQASNIESWQRVNVDSLAVHERPGREYKVIDTLPLRLPVLVKEEYQDWCAIDYRGLPKTWSDGLYSPLEKHPPPEHHGGYWIACAKLVPFLPARHVKPQISTKEFLMFAHLRDGDTLGRFLTSGENGYLNSNWGHHFEIVSKDGRVTLISYDGNTITATDSILAGSEFVTLPWDVANNLPVYTPPPPEESLPKRYLYFVASMLDNYRLPWWIVISLAGGIGFLFSLGRRSEEDIPGAFLSCFLLVIVTVGSCQGGNINRRNADMSHLKESSETFSHLDFDGRTLPFEWEDLPGNKIEMLGPVYLEFGDLIWAPIFILAHIAILVSIPRIVRGVHFLLSSPPDARKLLSRSAAGKTPPPAWVSQNWVKHLNAREAQIKSRITSAKAKSRST